MKKNLLILFCIIVCINKIHAQTNWDLLNPKPTVSTGKDVKFVTGNIGYIITSNELLETLDAGDTWLIKQNISGGNDMSFYNTTGYIVGDAGYVLKSTDNGTSWNQVSTGFNSSFNTVNIIDTNNIILSSANSIIKTNDGGITWESLSIPNVTVNKTSFTSSLVGHAVCNAGTILKTIDGGENWYITESTTIYPSSFFTVYFINETLGFATREHSDMFKTTDGGENWVEISGTVDAIFDFHFLDENFGFITGNYGATYKTNDGGNTWIEIFYQNGYVYGTSMYGIHFQDSNIGYATGAWGRIIKTTDGGNTWIHHSPTYNDISQIDFSTNNIGYALVRNSLFKTTDTGNTWNNIGSPVEDVKTYKFDFINENIGYALVGGTVGTSGNTGSVFKTIDGGISWTQLNNGNEIISENLYAIDFINETIGCVSGGYNQRKVMKTTDGGNNWTQVSDQSFGQIQFVNNLVGYANRVGNYYGAMYKTIDSGTTWDISIELEGEDINALHFVDENNGYFVGDEGLIYKTNDGGTNWQELNIPYERYNTVNFYSKNVGYIADEDGKLYKTENGGASWEFLTQQNAIESIDLIDDKIYTAGSNGKIYRSDIEFETIVLHVNPAENISYGSASLTGNVTSNGQSISNIQFEYSSNSSFNNIITTNPSVINPDESVNVSVDLTNLNQNTTYYFRLKGVQNSLEYTSEILTFTTLPEYNIILYDPNINGSNVTFTAYLTSNHQDITDIVFEYGSIDYENSIISDPPQISANNSGYVSATITNLDINLNYYYRVKAMHNGEAIYSEERIFNFSGDIMMMSGTIEETQTNSLELRGLINTYGAHISNIHFEYGVTNSFGSSIDGTPHYANGYGTHLITSLISDPLPNQTYYYRLVASYNGNTIYSDTYQYTTPALSLSDFISEEAISIYPNPATNFVKIKSKTFEKVSAIELYDVLGKLVYFENILNANDIKIDVANFRKGIYFLKVNFESAKTKLSKLIVK